MNLALRTLSFASVRRLSLRLSMIAIALSTTAPLALAAPLYPDRPITLVVPNPAGGEADHLARRIAKALTILVGQPVVVENVSGASGALAAMRVLRALPDGYTLLFGTTSDMIIAPISNKTLGYTTADFTPIAMFGFTPMTLVVRTGLGVDSVDALVALARRAPGTLSIGTAGERSLQAYAAEALVRAGRIELTRVPYRGGAVLLQDLVGGRLDVAVVPLPAALRYAELGKIQVLGTLSTARAAIASKVPTVNEGRAIRGIAINIWAGLAGPSGMPANVVDVLNQAVNELLTDAGLNFERARMGDTPASPTTSTAFGHFLRAEEDKFLDIYATLPKAPP